MAQVSSNKEYSFELFCHDRRSSKSKSAFTALVLMLYAFLGTIHIEALTSRLKDNSALLINLCVLLVGSIVCLCLILWVGVLSRRVHKLSLSVDTASSRRGTASTESRLNALANCSLSQNCFLLISTIYFAWNFLFTSWIGSKYSYFCSGSSASLLICRSVGYSEIPTVPCMALSIFPLYFCLTFNGVGNRAAYIAWTLSTLSLAASMFTARPDVVIPVLIMVAVFTGSIFLRNKGDLREMFTSQTELLETSFSKGKAESRSVHMRKEQKKHDTELRHMIGNMAHDLKTPLASFSTGTEMSISLIDDALEELLRFEGTYLRDNASNGSAAGDGNGNEEHSLRNESKGPLFDDTGTHALVTGHLKAARSCLEDVRNTNSFMVMTINRAIDFTKASKGVKLVYKPETVELQSTLGLPMKIMSDMQTRISLHMEALSPAICSHVITDKQWLQENLLCLLSNAVKYSSKGAVVVTVRLLSYVEAYLAYPQFKEAITRTGLPLGGSEYSSSVSAETTTGSRTTGTPAAGAGATRLNRAGTNSNSNSNNSSSVSNSGSSLADVYSHRRDSSSTAEAADNESNRVALASPPSTFLHRVRNCMVAFCGHSFQGGSSGRQNQSISSDNSDTRNKTISMQRLPDLRTDANKSEIENGSVSAVSMEASMKRHENSHDDPIEYYLLIEVMDMGIGLSDQAMKTLFNPFKQAQRLAGGTGLGLFSLAKRMEAIKGLYGVKRRPDGTEGSLFWFAVPYRPDTATAQLLARSQLERNDSNGHLSVSSESAAGDDIAHPASSQQPAALTALSTSPSAALPQQQQQQQEQDAQQQHDENPQGSQSSPQRGKESKISNASAISPKQPRASRTSAVVCKDGKILDKLHVLVVEDALSVQKMTAMLLKRQGFTMELAENGAEAVEKMVKRYEETLCLYDLVLMDMQMPVMDGVEATRRLRQIEAQDKTQRAHSKTAHLLPGNSAALILAAPTLTAHREHSNEGVDSNSINNNGGASSSSAEDMYKGRRHQLIIGCTACSDNQTMHDAIHSGMDAVMSKPLSITKLNAAIHEIGSR